MIIKSIPVCVFCSKTRDNETHRTVIKPVPSNPDEFCGSCGTPCQPDWHNRRPDLEVDHRLSGLVQTLVQNCAFSIMGVKNDTRISALEHDCSGKSLWLRNRHYPRFAEVDTCFTVNLDWFAMSVDPKPLVALDSKLVHSLPSLSPVTEETIEIFLNHGFCVTQTPTAGARDSVVRLQKRFNERSNNALANNERFIVRAQLQWRNTFTD